MERRIFFKRTGTFALGTLILPACSSNPSEQSAKGESESTTAEVVKESSGSPIPAIGLQLYSIRDVLEGDLEGDIKKLAEIGYTDVESYPGSEGHYYGMEAEAFAKLLQENGMRLVSSHVGSGKSYQEKADSWKDATLVSRFDELVDHAAKTGQPYLTCSMAHLPHETPEERKKLADLFNSCGKKCNAAGMKFAYHNHAFEFEGSGDEVLMDFLMANTDPELVKYQMDIYWVVKAGKDPVAYFKKYPGRFTLSHIKDMDKEDSSKNAVVGEGSIDYTQILPIAKESGMEFYLVEQETYKGTSMEAMEDNYAYLKQLRI
jgi:sugar phosphate isomerase/epimerase